jgi:hypothetical protein
MMGSVVLNLSGLMSGLLHLFLRSNTATSSFGPRDGTEWKLRKHQIRIWGPNELVSNNLFHDPLPRPPTPAELEGRNDSLDILIGAEKAASIGIESVRNQPFTSSVTDNPMQPCAVELVAPLPDRAELPAISKTAARATSPKNHARKQSYSLFPPELSNPIRPKPTLKPSDAVENVSDLEPPPLILGGSRHRRDSSVISSATVQIGLRLSHAPGHAEEDFEPLPLPQPAFRGNDLLSVPATNNSTARSTTTEAIPISTNNTQSPRIGSPLKLQTKDSSNNSSHSHLPKRPSPLATNVQSSNAASINKTLPPTPRFSAPPTELLRNSNTQLSPAVYSPQNKKASPMTLARANTIPSPRAPLSPLALAQQQIERASKLDWI